MITLTLKEQPSVPLEAEVLSPDVMADLSNEAIRALPVYLGKRQRRLDDFFNVEARVSLDQTNLFSPVTNLLPIVNVAHGQPAASFFIPATDPEGDTLTWTISTTLRSMLTKAAPDGSDNVGPPTLSINASTGEVTTRLAAMERVMRIATRFTGSLLK